MEPFRYFINKLFGKEEDNKPKTQVIRKRKNTSKTGAKSDKLEFAMYKNLIRNDRHKPEYRTHTPQYDIPYIKSKEIKLNDIGSVSSNALDSIAKYARKTGLDIDEAVGLAAHETGLGHYPLFNDKNGDTQYNRALHNSDYFMNFGSIPAEYLVRDFEYNKGGRNKGIPIEDVPPLEHAFNYYKSGLYNPAVKEDHYRKVKAWGERLSKDKTYQTWKQNSKYTK